MKFMPCVSPVTWNHISADKNPNWNLNKIKSRLTTISHT